jgi:hypothetical protein
VLEISIGSIFLLSCVALCCDMSAPPSAPGSTPVSGTATPTTSNRHAQTATERQRAQLDRLLKDPAKPAHIPDAPKEKSLRPAREMMKNVQGSSAGAGSGEFHVYKASRRREYERLKMMEEESAKVRTLNVVFRRPGTHFVCRRSRQLNSRSERWSGNRPRRRRRRRTVQNETRRRYVGSGKPCMHV